MRVSSRFTTVTILAAALACGQASVPSASSEAVVDEPSVAAADPAAVTPSAEQTALNIRVPGAKPALRQLTESDELITVVVELAAAPVAVVRSEAPDQQISDAVRDSVAESIRQDQVALYSGIEAQGGKVMAAYQHALNGIRVQIRASRVGALTLLPGVIGVRNVQIHEMHNAQSVPYIGAPTVWGNSGFHGEGSRVAVLDTGVDFTHANFGGVGTAAAYDAAHAASTAPADPNYFGSAAPKVKGGTDLVGDDYDASARLPDGSPDTAKRTPHPDPNPLDCNGHGSHVSGTIAGFGVTSAGVQYSGPYDASTPSQSFSIGPGVAPKADIYAVRVFGCSGSTDVVVDAIDWVTNDGPTGGHNGVKIHVINMSLGSSFGDAESADALASTNAESAGIIVVASAGNSGNSVRYIVGSPSTGNKVVSVAAVDSKQTFPGATVVLRPSGTGQTWQNSNAGTLPSGSLPIQTLRNTDGSVSLGCSESEYADPATGNSKVTGNLVVSVRGVCARIYRAQAAFAHGAAGAALINNAAGYPAFEGDIMSCIPGLTPDNANGRPCEQAVPGNGICQKGTLTGTGANARCVETPELVTWAFFGVRGTGTAAGSDGALLAASTSADTFTAATVTNPTANTIASFSSSGPRSGYNANGYFSPSGRLKPNISAPGVSILSTAVGTGNKGEVLSGTSMAAPHVAGVMALAVQAHPVWTKDDIRIAVENTAKPTLITGWAPRQAGAGLVQPVGGTQTQVVARGDTGNESDLSYGAVEFTTDYSSTRRIVVRNLGVSPAAFDVSAVKWTPSSAHTVAVAPPALVLAPGAFAVLQVSLTVPASTAGDSGAIREVGGYISLTATGGTNGGANLAIPYYLVPRARAQVAGALRQPFDKNHPSSTVVVQNGSASVTGRADLYSFGASGNSSKGAHGIRALGVKSAVSGTDRVVTFAVNTFKPNSAYYSGRIEYDIDITLDGNTSGTPDFTMYTQDLGLATAGAYNGQLAVILVNNLHPDDVNYPRIDFLATAPTEGSLVLMPALASTLGLSSTGTTRFTYKGFAFFAPDDPSHPTANIVDSTGTARFNAYTPAFSATVNTCATGCTASGTSLVLQPAGQALYDVTINTTEWAQTPTFGVIMVARENWNYGTPNQAQLFRLRQ